MERNRCDDGLRVRRALHQMLQTVETNVNRTEEGLRMIRELTTTRRLARHALSYSDAALSPSALMVAKQCVLDWFAVTLAAQDEPLLRILREEIEGKGPATIIGAFRSSSPTDAALVNGAASHALDYDDCHHFVGHPTVGVF